MRGSNLATSSKNRGGKLTIYIDICIDYIHIYILIIYINIYINMTAIRKYMLEVIYRVKKLGYLGYPNHKS